MAVRICLLLLVEAAGRSVFTALARLLIAYSGSLFGWKAGLLG